jgi:hypothetical protein
MIWEPFAEFWQLLQRMPSYRVAEELEQDFKRFYMSADGPCILTGKVE